MLLKLGNSKFEIPCKGERITCNLLIYRKYQLNDNKKDELKGWG